MAVNEKDKYYTPDWLVKHTIKKAIEIIGKDNITEVVEPSAGDGAFIEQLKRNFNGIPHHYYDTSPEHPEITKQDYKTVRLSYKKGRLTIGNPPFGTSSSLWKAFCKKAATNSDFIVFISPASQYNSNYYFKEGELIYSELLNDVEYRGSETENGKNQKVRTCLNIYKVYDRDGSEDWRLGRLEQDVLLLGDDKKSNYDIGDFFLRWQGSGSEGQGAGRYDPKKRYAHHIIIKVLNKNLYDKVKEFCISFEEKYKDDRRRTTLTGYMNGHFLKEELIKHLYPTREERLEQDVLITRNETLDCDFYMGRMYNHSLVDKNTLHIGVKILNENIRDKVEEVLKHYEEYIKTDEKADILKGSIPGMKEYLIKHLYPTRQERLEQDVLFISIDPRESKEDKDKKYNDADFYLRWRGSNNLGAKCGALYMERKYSRHILIKVLNKNLYDKVKEFCEIFEKKYSDKMITDSSYMNGHFLKEQLIKHLYPTREERLEQDIIIKEVRRSGKNLDFKCDFYMCAWGAGGLGKIYKELQYENQIGIKILNENLREKIEEFFKSYREKHYLTGLQNKNSGEVYLNYTYMNNKLIQLLYPEDLYEDYPEIKKPIHIERAIYAKELF